MPASKRAPNGQSRLIRVLAHDLRNPISGILAASQCLLEDASALLDSQQLTLLRSIEASSELMLHLIENMLELAPAGAGKPKTRLRAADVVRLVQESAAFHRPLAEAKGVRLDVLRRDAEVPLVDLDPQKLTRALNALLSNLLRCSPPGGLVEVNVTRRTRSVVIAARPVGGAPLGYGSESAAARRSAPKASTITLAAVRLIVEAHGGTIRVERRSFCPGFTMELPASRGSATLQKRRAPSIAKAQSGG
jgi:signal transduction histidine kinase